MTQNKRIILNVFATYGRTIFSVVCGLFTVRWVLMALGHEGFGVYGVVGSMAIFVGFLNVQLADALARFYAVSIGRLKVAGNRLDELEECRNWFSCGVAIHLVVPAILVVIGYPLGVYALEHGWISVPLARMNTCVWLWRFSCISSFVAMVNSPFSAMYIAKQYIAELTIYSFMQTLVRTVFIYLMTIIPGDWLFGYGLGMCLIAVVPQLIICWRAFCVFDECRLRRYALLDMGRVRKITAFACWKMVGAVGYIARHQCLEVIVNRHFGPKANASYTVAATFSAEAAALTGALNGAFGPVIASACGGGQIEYMKKMAMRSCKFGALLTLMFAIPMFLEANEVLRLWLKNPPEYATPMCMIMLCVVVVEKLTLGHYMAISAVGDIRGHMFWRGIACLLAIPFAMFAIGIKSVVVSVPMALFLATLFVMFPDVYYAKAKASIKVLPWLKCVLLPIGLLTIVCGGAGASVGLFMQESFLRICVTTAICLSCFFLLTWCLLLDTDEKDFARRKARSAYARLLSWGVGKNRYLCTDYDEQ